MARSSPPTWPRANSLGAVTSEAEVVHLQFPARPEFLRLARLAAADAGSRAGFDYEEIEDLRLAVSESCAMISPRDGSAITVAFVLTYDAVEVEGSTAGPSEAHPTGDLELAHDLVAAAVDEHTLSTDGGQARFHLVKRRRRL